MFNRKALNLFAIGMQPSGFLKSPRQRLTQSAAPGLHRLHPSRFPVIIIVACFLPWMGCLGGSHRSEVVIYTSLDQSLSEGILQQFEKDTGIQVLPVYDTEATKTTGLVNRLIEEKEHPKADVFWNSEAIRTVVLKRQGVLEPYRSSVADRIPARYRDPDGFWVGFAARRRVLICNTDLVPSDERPRSIFDLTQSRWKGKIAMANPMFGTTSTHCAALFSVLGRKRAEDFFRGLRDNQIAIVSGNATSKDRVAAGEYLVGFTDSDDVRLALSRGLPVASIDPDQDSLGTLLIPNTIALIRGAPHAEAGKKLIDYILSGNVESQLAFAQGGQIPLRPGVERPVDVPGLAGFHVMEVDFEKVADQLEFSGAFLRELFLR